MPSAVPDIVFAGIGVASGLGYGKAALIDGLLAGRDVFGPLTRPGRAAPEGAAPFLGVEIADPPQILPPRLARTIGLGSAVAVAVVDGNVVVRGVEPASRPRRKGAWPARSARLAWPSPSTSTTHARSASGRPSSWRASAAPATSAPTTPAMPGSTCPTHGPDAPGRTRPSTKPLIDRRSRRTAAGRTPRPPARRRSPRRQRSPARRRRRATWSRSGRGRPRRPGRRSRQAPGRSG